MLSFKFKGLTLTLILILYYNRMHAEYTTIKLAQSPFVSFYLYSSLTIEYEEDYEDVTVNQMLAPKSQDTDTTEILNNLLKEYDKKLRPDIGGNWFFCFTHCGNRL